MNISIIQMMGAWMSMLPSTVNGKELGAQEWRDYLFLRYGINPPGLTDPCDSCGPELLICHGLNYKKGGLIKAHHNKLGDGADNPFR